MKNTSIILTPSDVQFLTNPDTKEGFISGIINILNGDPIIKDDSPMSIVLQLMRDNLRTPTIIGIPKYDPTGMSEPTIKRCDEILDGCVPAEGLDMGYGELKFKSIIGQDKKYLNQLHHDCRERQSDQGRDIQYRKFVGYIADTLEWFGENILF